MEPKITISGNFYMFGTIFEVFWIKEVLMVVTKTLTVFNLLLKLVNNKSTPL
jgi:hypothetical protein